MKAVRNVNITDGRPNRQTLPRPIISSRQHRVQMVSKYSNTRDTRAKKQVLIQQAPLDTTVRELAALNAHEVVGRCYIVDIAVKDLTRNEIWWYQACTGCKRTAIQTTEEYKCLRCEEITSEPRYKVAIRGTDIADESKPNAAMDEFIFFGDIGQELVGLPVLDLTSTAPTVPGFIPPAITRLYGAHYRLTISGSRGITTEIIRVIRGKELALPLPISSSPKNIPPSPTASTTFIPHITTSEHVLHTPPSPQIIKAEESVLHGVKRTAPESQPLSLDIHGDPSELKQKKQRPAIRKLDIVHQQKDEPTGIPTTSSTRVHADKLIKPGARRARKKRGP